MSTASAARILSPDEARRALGGREIVVPASIANLGAGFDALAVAVQLYLRVRVRAVDDVARNEVHTHFTDGRLDGQCYIARSVRTLATRNHLDFPSLDVEVSSDIPMQAGLGSSAAAIVAGLRLYSALAGDPDVDILTEGTALEGHPDNIAAATLGGLAIGCVADGGRVIGLSCPWPEDLRFVTATPQAQVKTPEARVVLPSQISRADGAFNLQRATLLIMAVRARRFDLLREALRDRWHQPYRTSLVPGLKEALELEHPDLVGVCLSGSGPTVAALCAGDTAGVEAAMRGIYERLGVACRIRVLAAHNPPAGTETERP